MLRTHFRPVSLVLLSLLAVALLAPGAFAQVGFPNPRPGASVSVQPEGSSFGYRDLTFDAPTDPIGTTYRIYLWRQDDPLTILQTSQLFTKSVVGSQPFTYRATSLEVNCLAANSKRYMWRVNRNGVTGSTWTFETPMENPVHQSTRVGSMVRFVWNDTPLRAAVGAVTEKMLLIRRSDPNVPDGWLIGSPTPAFNAAAVVKTYNPQVSDYRSNLREFWWSDPGYTRLQEGRSYRWRVVYCNKDGAPLSIVDANNNNAYISLAWADGGGDYDEGWDFTVVNEVSYLSSGTVKSVIVYWQSMYGTLARDPEEQDVTFSSIANRYKDIQENVHKPSVATVVVGTEELAASYGDFHYDQAALTACTAQQALVPTIPQWPGWDTMDVATKNTNGFSYSRPGSYVLSEQEKYESWVARGLRTWLQDAANRNGFGTNNDYAWLENLQHVMLIGDADRIAPSFYYDDTSFQSNQWIATDFFYSTQDDTATVKTIPRYQVGRIPVRQKGYPTIDQFGSSYDPPIPVLAKTQAYVAGLGDANGKTAAYNNWFGRAVVVAGATYHGQWFQFFPAVAEYLLTQRIQIGNNSFRDTFAGLGVHKYDIFGEAGTNEALTTSNIKKNLADPTQASDVPGFVYMLTRADNQRWWEYTGNNAGQAFMLWPPTSSFETDPEKDIDTSVFSAAYTDAAAGRRPLLVSAAADTARFDNAIFNSDDPAIFSMGEAGTLAPGGPIGTVGFASGYYSTSVTYQRTFAEGNEGITWTGGTDEREGYLYASINQGVVVDTPQNSESSQILLGKSELVCDFANEYAKTNMPTLGGLFNNAMASYLSRHTTDLMANEPRVTTTVFGATLLADPAILLPLRVRPNQDNSRPVVTDVNPRMPTLSDPTLPSYNTQSMPVHIVPHMVTYDANGGVDVTLRIQTDADNVRIRVITPFRQNSSNNPGVWNDQRTVGNGADPINWSWDTAQDREVRATSINQATYTFNAKAPSIYLMVVQAENPKWQTGDDEDWRWLQERWIYVQVVNAFQRSSDSGTNILVLDGDQMDRYYLGGNYHEDVEEWYVHPAKDDAGYDGGDDPVDYTHEPALSVLNKELGPDIGATSKYKYQYWCTNVYQTELGNALEMRQAQRFMGDIYMGGLNSFLTSKGTVVYFTGDASLNPPEGYLFLRELMEVNDISFLTNYINGGGRLLLSNQNMVYDAGVPFVTPFQHTILGAISRTGDTDYTNMDGLKPNTMSASITDLNIVGGTGNDAGQDNAEWTGEVDPNGIEALTLFTWSDAFGPGTTTGSKSSGVSNRILDGGGRTIYFTWPFEAIWTLGTVDPGSTGRANTMRQAIDWLRSVPKASNPVPADLATAVSLSQVLSWSLVPEAANYRLYLVAEDQANLEQPANLHDNIPRDNPRFAPGAPLLKNTRYFWRVDTKNVDDYTIGDVWSFKTVDDAPQASTPTPADQATQVPLDQVLSWYLDPLVDSYDLTIWKDGVALPTVTGLTTASYTPTGGLEPNRVYTWRVDTRNELGLTTGIVWTFYSLTPPPPPGNPPNPGDNALGVATNQKLSWTATPRTDSYDIFIWVAGDQGPADPPAGDPFNGTTPDPTTFNKWSGRSTTNSFIPGELPVSSNLNWQVRPVNIAGRQNGLDAGGADTGLLHTWTFSTVATVADPVASANPIYPPDGAFGVGVSPTLSWERGQGASAYNVFFWPGDQPEPTTPRASGLTSPTLAIAGPLVIGKLYKWQVVALNSTGTQAPGAIWTFTVGAAKVTGMTPGNGAVGVAVDVTLDWNDAQGASSYNVYIAEGATGVLALAANVTDSDFTPDQPLKALTTYRWRVDSVADDGVTVTTGDIFSFTTTTLSGPPKAVTNMKPLNGTLNIGPFVTLSWTGGAGAVTYDVYLGANALPGVPNNSYPSTVTQVINTTALSPNTVYYWKVRSVNAQGFADSPTFSFTTMGLPDAVVGMKPFDGTLNVVTNVILKWQKAKGATSYSLFLGANALPAAPTVTGLSPLLTQYQTSSLAASTLYYWKVRSVNDMGFTDSPVFTFTTGTGIGTGTTGGGGGGGGCFIATSAFESAAPGAGDRTEINFTGLYSISPERIGQLNQIRDLRDSLLLPLAAGRDFSAWYYAVGPHAADAIRHNEPAKAAVRKALLDPLSQCSRRLCE